MGKGRKGLNHAGERTAHADHPSPKIGCDPHELGSDAQATDSSCISTALPPASISINCSVLAAAIRDRRREPSASSRQSCRPCAFPSSRSRSPSRWQATRHADGGTPRPRSWPSPCPSASLHSNERRSSPLPFVSSSSCLSSLCRESDSCRRPSVLLERTFIL